MRRTSIAVVLSTLVIANTPAIAQEPRCDKKSEAQSLALFEDGKRAYRLQQFDKAIDSFTKAYELCGNPAFLLNIGLAYRQKNDFPNAIAFYKSFLKEDPNTDQRAKLEQRIAEMEATIEEQKRTKERPPTEVQPPGPSRDQPSETIDALPTRPPDSSSVEPWYRDRAGWVLVASGVVAVGVGGALFLHGGTLHDDALAEQDHAQVASLIDSANTYRVIGSVLFWTGTAVVVAGGVKLAITESPSRKTGVAVGPGWLVVRGSF